MWARFLKINMDFIPVFNHSLRKEVTYLRDASQSEVMLFPWLSFQLQLCKNLSIIQKLKTRKRESVIIYKLYFFLRWARFAIIFPSLTPAVKSDTVQTIFLSGLQKM